MKIAIPRLAALWIFLLLLIGGPALQAEIIKVANPTADPVIDNANVMTDDEESSLRIRLRTLADTDGSQVVVLTVPTTGDEDIFTFSQRTATEWGIGQKTAKGGNGVLFAIATNDRKSFIQVGYGLEGRLTDALSKRILTTLVTPQFKQGQYYAGISAGVDAIISAVKGEYKADPAKTGSSGDVAFWIIIIVLVILFVYSARGGRGGRGGGGGGGGMFIPNVWTTGGGSSGWGHSSGDSGGGGFGGGFGGGGFGGGGAGDSW